MKSVWTEAALADLDNALAYTRIHFPQSLAALEARVRATVARIEHWPESAREVENRPGVRVVPLIRYPYRIFYRVAAERIEILHFHHGARSAEDS